MDNENEAGIPGSDAVAANSPQLLISSENTAASGDPNSSTAQEATTTPSTPARRRRRKAPPEAAVAPEAMNVPSLEPAMADEEAIGPNTEGAQAPQNTRASRPRRQPGKRRQPASRPDKKSQHADTDAVVAENGEQPSAIMAESAPEVVAEQTTEAMMGAGAAELTVNAAERDEKISDTVSKAQQQKTAEEMTAGPEDISQNGTTPKQTRSDNRKGEPAEALPNKSDATAPEVSDNDPVDKLLPSAEGIPAAERPARRRRNRRNRRRLDLSPEELARLAEDNPLPDYVSDDDDDEDPIPGTPTNDAGTEPIVSGTAVIGQQEEKFAENADNNGTEIPAASAESPVESRPGRRSRRSRRGRRRGPEAILESRDVELEDLNEDQTVELETDVLEELMANVLDMLPPAPATGASSELNTPKADPTAESDAPGETAPSDKTAEPYTVTPSENTNDTDDFFAIIEGIPAGFEDEADAGEVAEPNEARSDSDENAGPESLEFETEETEIPETASRSRRSRSRRGRGRKSGSTDSSSPESMTSTAEPDASLDDSLEATVDESVEDENAVSAASRKSGAPVTDRKMLISVLPGDQVEVVITEEGQVREYYVEMTHQVKLRGNIYKGIISNIDTNLQAAFVNYGNPKNGFLQIDEVHPEYYLQPYEASKGHKYPPIQKVLKVGQEVLVQVVKEPNGNKGAFLTTWVSLAGRFIVLTPGQEQIGISRKVEDPEERNRLRDIIKGMQPEPGFGAIVRTVSAGTTKTTLQKDMNYLKRAWKDIRKKATTEKAPKLIYQEPGLASRSVRDYLSDTVSEIWCDDENTAESVREMTALLFPRKPDLVHLYTDHKKPMWEYFNVLSQIDQIQNREVILPSGGRLVFDQTEALMAIDINSGKIGGKTNFEAMAYRTNKEAARAIAQQLRLRDIGGQVVIDFIEMRDPDHCRDVEKELRSAMKVDRARHDIGKMSSFGLLQIVRQRIGSSAISISMETCPHCNGTGMRRTLEWQSIHALREVQRGLRVASANGQTSFPYVVEPELGLYLLNHKRERLSDLEQEFNVRVEIRIEGITPGLQPTAGNGKHGVRP